MRRQLTFDDGSSIAWNDRETLRYSDGHRTALVWLDYESGLFSRGRVIRTSSIEKWEKDAKTGIAEPIHAAMVLIILEKVRAYLGRGKIPFREIP
jgi:hypothetical protein